jgi:cytochrome c biogenesis protein ResB
VFTIEVNRPLRVGRLKVYQSSFHRLPALTVEREGAGTSTIIPGHTLPTSGGGQLRYFSFEGDSPDTQEEVARGVAVFEEWRGSTRAGQKRVALGARFEGYRLVGLKYFSVTGLHVVRDPGFPLVIAALLLAAFGLSLSVIQNVREEDNV